MTFRNVPDEKLRWGQLALLVVACLFGFDYLTTPPDSLTPTLNVVADAFPIPMWGTAFAFFGVLGLLGELWIELGKSYDPKHPPGPWGLRASQRWWYTYAAHAALCTMYAGVGVGYFVDQVVAHHLWGLRSGGLMFLLAIGHFVFLNRGPK